MKHIIALILLLGVSLGAFAQGPPITLDKPIMLGAKQGTFRALYWGARGEYYNFSALMMEADYNVRSNLAFATEVPVILPLQGWNARIGDISLIGKYQFIRKDGMGKSTRVSAKIKHVFPTGIPVETPVLGMGGHMTYGGLVYAHESLKLGVQSELGYMRSAFNPGMNHLLTKVGMGIPLLEPSYPVKQINIYTEFEMQRFKYGNYSYFFAPGLQFARGKYTVEVSYQMPLAQKGYHATHRQHTLLIGGRVVLF